jgi:hypothetical protein
MVGQGKIKGKREKEEGFSRLPTNSGNLAFRII